MLTAQPVSWRLQPQMTFTATSMHASRLQSLPATAALSADATAAPGSQVLTFMGFLLTPLTLTAFLSAVYSLLWRRASMAVFRLPTKALWEMTLLGNSLSWLTMIAPCTTTKRSTALICTEQLREHCKMMISNWSNAILAMSGRAQQMCGLCWPSTHAAVGSRFHSWAKEPRPKMCGKQVACTKQGLQLQGWHLHPLTFLEMKTGSVLGRTASLLTTSAKDSLEARVCSNKRASLNLRLQSKEQCLCEQVKEHAGCPQDKHLEGLPGAAKAHS